MARECGSATGRFVERRVGFRGSRWRCVQAWRCWRACRAARPGKTCRGLRARPCPVRRGRPCPPHLLWGRGRRAGRARHPSWWALPGEDHRWHLRSQQGGALITKRSSLRDCELEAGKNTHQTALTQQPGNRHLQRRGEGELQVQPACTQPTCSRSLACAPACRISRRGITHHVRSDAQASAGKRSPASHPLHWVMMRVMEAVRTRQPSTAGWGSSHDGTAVTVMPPSFIIGRAADRMVWVPSEACAMTAVCDAMRGAEGLAGRGRRCTACPPRLHAHPPLSDCWRRPPYLASWCCWGRSRAGSKRPCRLHRAARSGAGMAWA